MGKTKIIPMHHIPNLKKRYDPNEENEKPLAELKADQKRFNKNLKRADKLMRIQEGIAEVQFSDDDVSDSEAEKEEPKVEPEEERPFDDQAYRAKLRNPAAINLGIPAEETIHYQSEKPSLVPPPEEEPEWKPPVGIDSTGILLNQQHFINNAETKARNLQLKVKKRFKGEEHLEHLYRDRALE